MNRLIKNGSDVNEKDNFGRNPLYNAIDRRDLLMVVFLIEKGADVNQDDGCGSALYLAMEKNVTKIISFLRTHGAKVSERTNSDITCS